MKIFNEIGSKERLFEIMQGVNKMKLNEDVMGSEDGFVDKAVTEFITGNLDIVQTNNQVNGNESVVEIVGKDDMGSKFIFKFNVSSNETDQQGVYSINDAILIELNADMPKNDVRFELTKDDSRIAEINNNYKQQLIDAISEYVEFESDADTVSDEMYEEAISFIDKIPYKKGSEEIQTQKAYADQKPVNPDVRVKSPELEKFVKEEEDMFKIPSDYNPDDFNDDGSVGTDPYDQEPEFDDNEEASDEEKELHSTAYDNLVAAGNQFPTPDQIDKEVLKLKGENNPVEKTRAIPKDAEAFWENNNVSDMNVDTITTHSFNNMLSSETKRKAIIIADQMLTEHLGVKKFQIPKETYLEMVKKFAVDIFKRGAAKLNEEEKNDYPDPMGKKFKPKNQMPKKKKKPQSVVKLKEEQDISESDEFFPITTPIGSQDDKLFVGVVNQGIDSHLEGFTKSNFETRDGRRIFNFHNSELPILLRRLEELGTEEALSWKHDIENYDETLYENDDIGDELDNIEQPEPAIEPDFSAMGQEDQPEIDVDDVSKAKEATGDQLGGGLADESLPNQFDPDQIAKGVKVEMEHTDNPLLAIEIAMDHLTEDPNYYGGTGEDPEEMAQQHASQEAEEQSDEEVTDELLGFKPHNVGDYTNEELDFAAQERNYADSEAYKRYLELSQKDFNTLPEEEKDEFFELWKEFRGGEPQQPQEPEDPEIGHDEYLKQSGQMKSFDDASQKDELYENKDKHVVVFDGTSAYVIPEDEISDDVEIKGSFDNIEDADALVDRINHEAGNLHENVELARHVLKNRRLNEGMTKEQAVKLLIRYNIK